MDGEIVKVNGFTVVPIKFDSKCKACHYLYIKQHKVKGVDPRKPNERTLFLCGVPPYCQDKELQRIFTTCGKIETVTLTDTPMGGAVSNIVKKLVDGDKPVSLPTFKYAYIVFRHPEALKKALKLSHDKSLLVSTPDDVVPTGMVRWRLQHKEKAAVDAKALQREIDQFMTEYDARVEEEKQREKEQEGVPDEDGWVTVTRHGKNKGVPWTEANEKKINMKEKKRRKEKELLNFYTFQVRETKREHIADLRRKFEEDKQKIALMKATRKFKPY